MKAKLFFSLFSISTIVFGQVPDWEWAKSGVGEQSKGYCTAADKYGNVYATGSFFGDTINLGGITLVNPNSLPGSMFLAKYNSNGIIKWARIAYSCPNANIHASGMATDTTGNIYMTGTYGGTYAVFEDDSIQNTGFENNSFYVKYDTSGNMLWVKNINGNRNDVTKSITTDKSGNIYLTGYFESDTLSLGNIKLVNAFVNFGSPNTFICKINAQGQALWVKKGVTNDWSGYSQGNSITTDPNGNVYVTGSYSGNTLTFDSIIISSPNQYYKDVFVVGLNSNGQAIWAKSAGGTANDVGNCITADGSGNIFIMGIFQSQSVTFDSCTLNLTSSMNNFLFKLDNTGNALWARKFGQDNLETGTDMTHDPSGNIFITGNYESDTITFGNQMLTKSGGNNFFVVKYNTSGDPEWVSSTGKAPHGIYFYNNANGICMNYPGNIYVAGSIKGIKVPFGPDSLSSTIFEDFFIAKLSFVSISPSSAVLCSGHSIQLTANGATTYTWSPSTGLSNTTGDAVIASPASSITYIVTGIKNGDISHSTATITVKPSLPTPIISKSDSLLISSNYFTNQWYLNGTVIPGATKQTYHFIQNGNYMVCATNYNDCTSCSAPYIITSLGIADGITKNRISISPNPNTGNFNIASDKHILSIEIINMLDQEIYRSAINSNSAQISLPKVHPGIHFVRLYLEGDVHHTEKIIIVN